MATTNRAIPLRVRNVTTPTPHMWQQPTYFGTISITRFAAHSPDAAKTLKPGPPGDGVCKRRRSVPTHQSSRNLAPNTLISTPFAGPSAPSSFGIPRPLFRRRPPEQPRSKYRPRPSKIDQVACHRIRPSRSFWVLLLVVVACTAKTPSSDGQSRRLIRPIRKIPTVAPLDVRDVSG